MDINGKIAVVFGGAQGMGRAGCEALLKKGAKVCFSDVNKTEGESTEKELKILYGDDRVCFLQCDVSSEDQIANVFKKALSEYGQVEIAVNNCGVLQEFKWEICVDINLGGNIRCINAARQFMGKDKGGKGGAYICTSSISALRPESWCPVYCAAKHAIVALVRSWALEKNFQIHGIKMNTICPTRVKTKFLDQVVPDRVYYAEDVLNVPEQQQYEMSPSVAGDGIIKLLEEGHNGQAMRIVAAGFEFAKFEEQPVQ